MSETNRLLYVNYTSIDKITTYIQLKNKVKNTKQNGNKINNNKYGQDHIFQVGQILVLFFCLILF